MSVENGVKLGDRPLLGIVTIIIGVMFMISMDAMVKYTVSHDVPVAQLLFIRGIFLISILLLFLPKAGGRRLLKSKRWKMHLLRGAIGCLAPICFFTALKYVALADMTVIAFASTFIAVGLSVLVLKETVGIHRWLAVCVGFLGVLIVLRPGTGVFEPVALLGLVTAGAYACITIMTRMMADTETPYQLVLSFNLVLTVATGLYALLDWQPMDNMAYFYIFMVSLLTLGSHMMVSRAYAMAPVAIIVPFEYTALIWAAILGYLVFGEIMDAFDWLGAMVIVACGLYITYRESRNLKRLQRGS